MPVAWRRLIAVRRGRGSSHCGPRAPEGPLATVFCVMAGVMAVAFVVSLIAMPSGKIEDVEQ
jgi:hypothetical protein